MEQGVFPVADVVGDERLRVFRRYFEAEGEFELMQVDAYVFLTERYLVVCDTLLCPEDVETMMQAAGHELAGRQLLVINSHADWDHTWGNCYFTGERAAPIIAHQHCLTRMLSQEAQVGLLEYQRRFPLFNNVLLTPPTLTFEHTMRIYGGDLALELIPAPGHHPDHMALWISELSLLLAFDAVEDPFPLIEDQRGVQPMFATLERFLTMQPRYVLCSHGGTTGLETVERNLAYLREIERRCRNFLATHHPGDEELGHAAELIEMPFEVVVADAPKPVDRTYYAWAHENNVRNIMRALIG